MKKLALILVSGSALWAAVAVGVPEEASAIPVPTIQFGVEDIEEPDTLSTALQIMFLLTVLTLAPSPGPEPHRPPPPARYFCGAPEIRSTTP